MIKLYWFVITTNYDIPFNGACAREVGSDMRENSQPIHDDFGSSENEFSYGIGIYDAPEKWF